MKKTVGLTGLLPVLAALALPAQAALPPCATESLIAEADTVVQMAEPVVLGTGDPMTCEVSGRIVHVFRGSFAVGDIYSATFPCLAREGMVGAVQVTDPADVITAPWVEIHVSKGAVAAYGAGLVLPEGKKRPVGEMLHRPMAMCR